MNPLDLLKLIPEDIRNEIRDEAVKFVSDQAKKYLGDEMSGKVKNLRSDGAFNRQFEKALQRALERFVAEYGDEDEDLVEAVVQNKALFKNEEVQAALLQIIKKPGAVLDKEREAVIQSFASVLPDRRNRARVDRAISYLLQCLAQEVWRLPQLQPVYSLQFQRLTAEAAREQVALQKAQLQALTEMNAGLKDALLQLSQAMEHKLLSAPAPALPQKPYHNLPRPDYAKFIGRETELTWLRQRLSPTDRAWQIAITGIGGVGKSALALAIAHEYRERYDQLPPEERFDAIIWVSAKEEVLTAQGREKAALPELVLHTLEDVYTSIARVLEREDITRAFPDDQGRLVDKALKEQRTLLVMDNLESVKDARIKPFLRNLPPPTKVVITSREWLDMAAVLALKGMTGEEAERFIIEEADARQVELDKNQRLRIYDLASGLPLPIKLSIARRAAGEAFDAVERWLGDADVDLPEYCIQGQAELAKQRDPNAWKLLLACSLFDRSVGASADALRSIADLSLADRDQGLMHLRRLFLIMPSENERYWTLPIVQRYASAYLSSSDYKPLTENWLSWLCQFCQQQGVELELRIEKIKPFSLEYPNLLNGIRWCLDQKQWAELAILCEWTWSYPYLLGIFHEMDEILTAAGQAASALQDNRLQGRIDLQRGRLAMIQGNPEPKVLEILEKAEKAAIQHSHWPDLAEAWASRITLLAVHPETIGQAQELAEKIWELGVNHTNPNIQILGANRLSAIATRKNQFKEALEWIKKAEDWNAIDPKLRTTANLLHRKASNFIRMGEYGQAEECLVRALNINLSWGGQRYIAYNKYRLAEVYKATGRITLAQENAESARDLFTRLGMPWDIDQINGFIASLHE